MIDELIKLIAENKVIPFVGAGVSKNIKYKDSSNAFFDWKELLSKLSSELEDENQKIGMKSLLKSDEVNYLLVADMIESSMSKNDFNKALKKVLDIDYNAIDETTYDLPKAIWNLNTNLIITTNYDKVLHKACEDENLSYWDIQSIHGQGNFGRDGVDKPTVWHLHGFETNPDDIILTSKSYNDFYTDNPNESKHKSALETLRTTINTKSLLFIGFSLDDEFFVKQLNRTVEIFGGNSHEHYILLKKGSRPSNLNKNIKVIEYENRGQPLIDKIKSLKSETNIEENTKVSLNNFIESKNSFNALTSLPAENKDYFIGRQEELEEIKQRLSSDNLTYIVNGIGGVGKSEISSRYFHENKHNYKNIAFIEISDTSSIEELFKTKLKEKLSLDDEDDFDTIIQRLQSLPQKNLLFLDNLEKREDFEKIKPLNTNFDLLITTRITDIDVKNQLNLDTLNPKDAKDLFLSIYAKDENISDILEYLDNHPLFINLTASSLKREYINLEELRESIKNQTISKIDSKDNKTFEEHLQSTFDKHFVSVDKDELKYLLQLLAFFPSIEIEYEVLEKCLSIEKLKVNLQKLVENGWLNKKDSTYKLHQIIKTFILDNYRLKYEDISFILKNIGDYINPDDSTLIANKLGTYIPIIESFLSHFSLVEDKNTCALYDSLTYIFYSQGLYDNSLFYQEKVYKIRKSIYTEKSEFIAKSENLLSIIYKDKGDIDKALEFQDKALKLSEEILGDKHPDLASSYGNISAIYKDKGNIDKALEFQEKALRLREEKLGDKHPDLASSYSNISTIYQDKGDLDKALEFQEKALKLREEILGDKHPDLATSYGNISTIYQDKGDLDKALEFQEKALKLREEILGDKHPDLASSYGNISTIYQDKGDLDKALEFQDKALKLTEEILGNKHPNLATSYNNISMIYKDKGDIDKALEFQKKALKLREEILGDNHPKLAISYSNISTIYQDLKECKKVIENIEKAIEIWSLYDFYKKDLYSAKEFLKTINKNIKKEKKLPYNKKGRYCKDL